MVGGWEFDQSFVYYQLPLSTKLNIVDCAWVFCWNTNWKWESLRNYDNEESETVTIVYFNSFF